MVRSRSPCRRALCAVGAAVRLSHNIAFTQHRDILLAGGEDGKLAVMGGASVFAGSLDPPFLDGLGQVRHTTSNPGFASLNASFLPEGYLPLPASSVLSLSIQSFPLDGLSQANLWYWGGMDRDDDGDHLADVAFAPLPTESTFRVYRGPVQNPLLSSGIADGSDCDQPGFSLAETTPGGGLHIHPS